MTSYADSLLSDFGVVTEEELQQMLLEDAMKIPCIKCGVEFDADELYYPDDDPWCERCLNG
jgi:hypothetical protein